ncbi:hypothetical protein [Scleromatobacter humisilvae]|uniref:Uncharacterized protein n=1 Tax=Scleromatobacter humisilvae TaxID=2897159 RepID=A0A9X2C3P4_9BURK|nr:hypothetical protein [Scleromatobacter humisilvae]MCK9687860.1 hypothetical protein [Scleromatobacter humisilvae]
MDALTLVLLALLVLAARTFHWRHQFAAWEPLWRFRSGPVTVELRRHADLARLEHDSLEYPQPREFRIITMRLGAIPLWSQRASVCLPMEADARIGAIAAGEFDHLFDAHFRRGWTHRPARLAARAH